MSHRGRPPKNGTPFDRLLKKQCQKGVSASKSAGMVGKWGFASFTSIRNAPTMLNQGSESVARPKKFFKSKNTSASVLDNEFEPIVKPPAATTAQPVAVNKPPSKFFKSKQVSAPAPVKAPPLRPIEVTPNQPQPQAPPKPLKEPKPEVMAKPEVMKVPPLKLRLKAGSVTVSEPAKPVKHESEESEDNASNDDYNSESSAHSDDDEEISFKEPSLVLKSPTNNRSLSPEPKPVAPASPPRAARRTRNTRNQFQSQPVAPRVPSPVITKSPSPPPREPSPREPSPRIPSPKPPSPKIPEPSRIPSPDQHQNGDLISSNSNGKPTPVEPIPREPPPPQVRSYTRTRNTRSVIQTAPKVEEDPILDEPVIKRFKPEIPPEKVFDSVIKPEIKAEISKPMMKSSSWSNPSSESDLENKSTLVKASSIATEKVEMPSVSSLGMGPPTSQGMGPPRPKKSIFKSKSQDTTKRKGLALYKHSFGATQEKDEKDEEFKQKVFHKAIGMDFDDDDFGDDGAKVTDMSFRSDKLKRVTTETTSNNPNMSMQEITSVKCPKGQKEYFTVIKNVKKAHQIQDSGEFQEFNDDVEYIMEGLKMKKNVSTRCLSTITLATKCMEPSFRMHLRAHGTMNQFFAELKDAPQNPGLALCTATVLFVLSQDRLNMDMDRDSLELMLNLLDTDSRIKDLDASGMSKYDLEKNKKKVQDLCSEMKSKGHALNLNIENISADHLSMETLLSMTSKRAGEWFKEELRELGGLDHLAKTMNDCVGFLLADEISVWTEQLQNRLRKAGRVLKVLESVTHENEENCQYLLKFQDGQILDLIHKLFKLLDEELPLNPNRDINDRESISHTLRESLFDVMRVYINLVHDYNQTPLGSKMAGNKPELFDIVLHCLFVMPDFVPVEKRFDVQVLTLTLIINLMEHCEQNRDLLLKAFLPQKSDDLFSVKGDRKTAGEGLVELFLEKEENARHEESKTDAILDGVKDEKENDAEGSQKKEQKTEQEVIDETVAKLLQKAGRHMEDTLIASYITLIVGYLIYDDKDREAQIRMLLPENDFSKMTAVLKKFFNFMNLTASSTVASNRGLKATETILKYLEKIDQPEEDKVKDEEENFDDITLFDVTKDESSITLQPETTVSSSQFDLDDDFDKL